MATTSSINPQLIEEIVRRIVDVSQPEKVILFGSQARGGYTSHVVTRQIVTAQNR